MAPVKKRMRRETAVDKAKAAEAAEVDAEAEPNENENETEETPTSASEVTVTGSTVPSLPDLQLLMKRMLDQVQESKSTESAPARQVPVQALQNDLLTLKNWQRTLLEQNMGSETALHAQHVRTEKRERALAALHYERAHLQGLIQKCQTYATPNLLQLATDELHLSPAEAEAVGKSSGSNSTTTTTATTNDNDMTAEQQQTSLTQFLGVDVNDPTQKQQIIARLHQELNRRGTLARDVKQKRVALEKVKAELANKRQLLDTLPDQLSVMERASKPLQKFFGLQARQNGVGASGVGAAGSGSTTSHMIGTERRARLDLARSLPAPLYTLFQQLQQYVDQTSTGQHHGTAVTVSIVGGGGAGGGGDKETLPSSSSSEQQVLLQLPVVDVSSANNESSTSSQQIGSGTGGTSSTAANVRHKRVTIHFHCYTHPTLHITAVASGCGSTLHQDILLDALFPHDSPPPIRGHRTDNVEQGDGDVVPVRQGRAYHWCNYMAGLHLVDRDCLPASTRVIVRELQRRIRANATLKYVLQSLQRKTLPTPPGVDKTATATSSGAGVKLVSFVLRKEKDKDKEMTLTTTMAMQETYMVSLRKGPANLKVEVQIHTSRYPAVPPVWSLNNTHSDERNGTHGNGGSTDGGGGGGGDSSSSGNGNHSPSLLYDDRLALLERRVNLEALDKAVIPDQEESYDWILVHQLRQVMQEWEGWLDADHATNSSSNNNNNANHNASENNASRKRKGRDRAPVTTTTTTTSN